MTCDRKVYFVRSCQELYAFTGNWAIAADVNYPDFDNSELVLGGLTTDHLPNPEQRLELLRSSSLDRCPGLKIVSSVNALIANNSRYIKL